MFFCFRIQKKRYVFLQKANSRQKIIFLFFLQKNIFRFQNNQCFYQETQEQGQIIKFWENSRPPPLLEFIFRFCGRVILFMFHPLPSYMRILLSKKQFFVISRFIILLRNTSFIFAQINFAPFQNYLDINFLNQNSRKKNGLRCKFLDRRQKNFCRQVN